MVQNYLNAVGIKATLDVADPSKYNQVAKDGWNNQLIFFWIAGGNGIADAFKSKMTSKATAYDIKSLLIPADYNAKYLEGAFYVGGSWFWPRKIPAVALADRPNAVKPHQHDFDEVLALFGTSREDPHDLCGELEVWLGNEKHIVTKSCIIYIPKGLIHGPIGFNRIDRPIFHFGCGPAKMYSGQM